MKNRMSLPSHRFIAFLLLLTLLLASCKQIETFIDLPKAKGPVAGEEIPGGLSSLSYLDCPSIPNTNRRISLAPYNEEVGDCALIGKSEEIEAWLTKLEGIAETCRTNREPNWANTLATRELLDAKIDVLQETEAGPNLSAGKDCVWHEASSNSSDSVWIEPPPTHYYTNWLMMIRSDVEKYCNMVDEIIKPLWQACKEINYYQDCQAPDPEQYHSTIKWKMNVAQINYDHTDFFYTNTLQVDGWDDFRLEFDESSINCAPLATFTFSMNAFCRLGPSIKYGKVATLLELQSVQIEGRNQDDPRWWWVLIPETNEHCWVSDSTGSAAGDHEDLKIIATPPLVVEPVDDQSGNNQPNNSGSCSADLDPRTCAGAGGTWTTSASGLPYCDCP